MFGTQDLLLFVLSALLLNITPGPDTLYIVGRSSTQGLKAGVTAALKLAGAAYLVYVGISLLRTRVVEAGAVAPEGAALRSVFVQGFWTNVLNPKVALFFLAFLPQFVDLDAPGNVIPLLFLGLLFNVNGTLWNLFVAWSSARLGRAVMAHGPAATWFNRSVGALFIYLGVRLALARE